MTDEEVIQNVSRAIGCTAKMDNHSQRAQIVLRAVRGEWIAPKPTNPQEPVFPPDTETCPTCGTTRQQREDIER